jgi:hypothetical protein
MFLAKKETINPYKRIGGNMMSLDTLVQNDLVNFRREVLKSFRENHPTMFTMMERVFAGRKNMVGMQVTENGAVVGTYTFITNGIDIAEVKSGVLESEIHHPLLGVVKPYMTVERSALEAMLKDERFKSEVFSTLVHYLPDLTIRFLR